MDIYNSSCNNSSNNNNHNSTFSNLFYKVIHNKYIFNLIFHHLHSRYDDYNQTTFRYLGEDQYDIKRIKFKDIVSLEFMLENKLYQLIKCKLEANEYIKVDTVENLWLNDIYNQDRQLSIEIAKLLLKSTSISNPDHPFRHIHLLNPELIQIATDPSSPHSIQVQRDMIDTAFNNSTTPQIKALLDSFYGLNNSNTNNNYTNSNNNYRITTVCNNSSTSCNNELIRNLDTLYSNTNSNNNNSTLNTFNQSSSEYINQFKSTIVSLAIEINDPFQRNRTLKLILSNSQYYSTWPSTSNPTNKRIKISQDSHSTPTINNNNNNIDSDLDIQLISIQDIVYGVISVDIQNQLLDLNYYYIPDSLSDYTDQINNIINSNNNSISCNNNNNYNNNNCNNSNKRSKDLLELFRDKGSANENSKLINDISSWFYDLENLQLIVSNNQDDWRGWNTEIEQYINSINLAESEERVKYYQSLQQIQELNHINQFIENRVSEQLLQPDYYCQGFYRKKRDYCERLNFIKSKEPSNDIITSNSFNNKNRIEPLELDINTIITSINNYSESGSVMEVYNSLSSLITLQYQSNNITTDSNQINFGSIDSYQQDPRRISSYSQQSTPFRILICWIKVFIISIKLGSNDRITLLLKLNFNPIIQHHQLFREIWYQFTYRFNCDRPVFEKHYKCATLQLNTQRFKDSKYHERDPNGMVEIIKVLLDNYQQHQQVILAIQQQHQQKHQQQLQNMESDDDDDQESERDEEYYEAKESEMKSKLSAADLVINYLFRMLIQSNGEIQLDTIKSIYKLINDSNIIKVQRSTLFSIYYLSLKSKYFIKYIATSPYLFNILNFSDNTYFKCIYCLDATQCRIEDSHFLQSIMEFDPLVFINPQVFTFEFVLLSNNNSFVNILKALVDRYMVKLFQDLTTKEDSEDYEKLKPVVNHTLSFLLEVREFGLFFHYLEQLKNYDTNYFNQHIQFTESLFKSMVLTDNQDAFYKLLKEYQPQFNKLLFSDKCDIRITFKYYHEINNIIPITKEPLYINFILCYSDVVVKIHALLFGDNKITNYKFDSINFDDYSIDHYKLLVNQYPNNSVLQLCKKSITQLIQSRSIIKLKQLYQNQLINDQPSDNEEYDKLLSFFKYQLKQHNINCKWL